MPSDPNLAEEGGRIRGVSAELVSINFDAEPRSTWNRKIALVIELERFSQDPVDVWTAADGDPAFLAPA